MNERAVVRIAAALLALGVVGACERGSRRDAATERMEAGVRVVESYEPAWGDRSTWSVGRRPELAIPAWSAPTERDSFHLVDAKKLTDGRLVIANGWMDEIGIYAADGTLEQRIGGEGLAPGHFQSLAFVEEIQGSLWAFDRMGRWNVYGLDGSLESTYYLEPHQGSWGLVAPFGTASLAVVDGFGGFQPMAESGRPALSVLLYDITGSAIGQMGTVPGLAHARVQQDGGMSLFRIPFTGLPTLAGGRQHLYLETGEGMSVDVLDEEGSTVRRMRIPNFDLSLSDEAWSAQLASYAAAREPFGRHGPSTDAIVALLNEHRPETRPAYGRMIEDALGNLWVAEWDERYERRAVAPSTRWIVFDPDGRWLGWMETHAGLTVTQIGEDFVLGLARTRSNNEARLYSLTR